MPKIRAAINDTWNPISAVKRRFPKMSYAGIADGAELLLNVPTYSITSSARASNCGGMAMPSTFAVFWLMTNWNFVGC